MRQFPTFEESMKPKCKVLGSLKKGNFVTKIDIVKISED